MDGRTVRLPSVIVALVAVLAACTAAGTTPETAMTPAGPAATPPAASITGGGPAGAEGFEGSLVTSGLYDATWKVSAELDAEPFNAYGARTLVADTGAFGNISVMPDGSVSFGSGAPELSAHGIQFTGTGARTTLDADGAFVCAFTVDTDLAAAGGAELHIAGSMTVHWHPEGVGGINCP